MVDEIIELKNSVQEFNSNVNAKLDFLSKKRQEDKQEALMKQKTKGPMCIFVKVLGVTLYFINII